MARGSSTAVSRDIQTLFDSGTAVGLTDRQLLDRFAGRRDPSAEAAFEALVRRHGPMVLRVCRNLLHDPSDAQDAFQATFLVLVRRCGALKGFDSLGGWLYGVACRVAARSRVEAARRRAMEGRAALRVVEVVEPADADDIDRDELGPIVQEEVRRLPEKYRAAVVLCYWEGLTQEQAAAQLGCPLGTVRSRLARARELLRRRLTRRGLAPMAVGMGSIRKLPPLAPEVVQSTVQVAVGQMTNQVVSGAVASLVQGVIWRTTMIKLGSIAAAGILLIGLAGYGVRVGAQRSSAVEPQAKPPTDRKSIPQERQEATARFEGIYCDVELQATILKILSDGSVVKKGDVVVELDSAALRDQLINQRITTKSAEANFRNAKLARENADHALTAYQGDLFPREEREAKGEVDVTERELAVAQGNLELFGGTGGSIVPEQAALNRKRAELDIARAKLALEKAGNRLHILTHYTKEKQIRGLETAVRMTHSDELAKQATWELEKSKEQKLERQIAACTIIAPIDGTVAHADLSRLNPAIGGPPLRIEPGSTVRERELILRIVPPPRARPDRR